VDVVDVVVVVVVVVVTVSPTTRFGSLLSAAAVVISIAVQVRGNVLFCTLLLVLSPKKKNANYLRRYISSKPPIFI